jgi:hypothetical protein
MSELGRVAYEAYCKQSDGKSLISGDQLLFWPEVPGAVRAAWDAAAAAVATEVAEED